ncbi:MAG: hypothetical protein ACREAF_03060 [Nitrosopumilaceae archaeon]
MLVHFIFVIKQDESEKRLWEFDFVTSMAQFYKSWIEKTFSKKVDVQSDQMIVKPSHLFNRLDVNALLNDHRKRGEDIYHFYLCYFRPLWTDCTCEGYYAENFGMVWWEQSNKKDDVYFLAEKNCTKVSHELSHEFLRQAGNKKYIELVHDVWDKHLFASLPFEYYDKTFSKTSKPAIFSTIDASSFRL